MNQFTFHHKTGKPAKIEMTVSAEFLQDLKSIMDIEVEILKGVNEQLDDGMRHCIIEVDGYKREMFEDFIRMLVKHPSMKVTMLGLPINNN